MMSVVKGYPPNIEIIRQKLPHAPLDRAVFAYGDTLYNPGGFPITQDLFVHEQTHRKQQEKMGPVKWWDKYLYDSSFRLQQEIEAYQNQYKYIKETKPEKFAKHFLREIAGHLSGPLYGNIVGFDLALTAIQNYDIAD